MFDEPGPEGAVFGIFHPEFSAGLFHRLGHARVIDVANPGKEVVFEMKVQPPKKPGFDRAVPVKAKGYLGLMDGPGIFHLIRVFTGQRKIGLSHAMRELEYDAQRHAHHDHDQRIKKRAPPQEDERGGEARWPI